MNDATETRIAGDRRGEYVSPKDRVVSTALWGLNLAYLMPSMGAITAVFHAVPSHKVDFLSKWYCKTQMRLTLNRWRAVVHPDVDNNRSYIFAQNHTNHFDHIAMYNATPHYKQGLELETHFKYPFYGWFMKARGTIPVPAEKSKRSEAILRHMKHEIDEGRSILAFPEGTRTLDGRVGEFKNGIFHMAIELGIPIAPVAVTGMYDVMRKGSLLIRPGNQVTVSSWRNPSKPPVVQSMISRASRTKRATRSKRASTLTLKESDHDRNRRRRTNATRIGTAARSSRSDSALRAQSVR
ncbi:MAG: lysophospholipid acyltransferase family protein [Polyangiales bacterium]